MVFGQLLLGTEGSCQNEAPIRTASVGKNRILVRIPLLFGNRQLARFFSIPQT